VFLGDRKKNISSSYLQRFSFDPTQADVTDETKAGEIEGVLHVCVQVMPRRVWIN